jgi:glycosyltransferase involved in cell wall biosynthesis
MKIAFLCPALSRTVGGIFEIERRLAQSLELLSNTHLEVFGPADEHTEADLPAWHPLKPKYFACTGGKSFRYSSTLRDAFLSTSADVSHIHALWMYNSILVHRWAQKNGNPYVVTPNGMLDPWALRNSGWKKQIASFLYERRMLSNAACIQANTKKEAVDIRAFGLKNPICIIPNGIDLPAEGGKRKAESENPPWRGMIEPGRKVLLFLSRIHPKKGLVNLLKAWAEVRKAESGKRKAGEWVLAIAGWDQGGHERELKSLCEGTFNIQHSTFNVERESGKRKAESGFQLVRISECQRVVFGASIW